MSNNVMLMLLWLLDCKHQIQEQENNAANVSFNLTASTPACIMNWVFEVVTSSNL